MKNLLFPSRCPFCGRIRAEKGPCERCMKYTLELSGVICERCGALPEFCKCKERPFSFVRNISAFTYAGGPRTMLLRMKARKAPQLAVFMANRMYYHIRGRYPSDFSVIVYVPQSKKKDFQRGYAPAQLLAEELARRFDLPVESPLVRVGEREQKYLTAQERRENAAANYKLRRNASLHGKVLLIDDLFTTGSTLDACAALLKTAGAEEVYTATFCITAKKS